MNTSFTLVAVDIAAFQPIAEFERRMEEFLSAIQGAGSAAGGPPVVFPGERSQAHFDRSRREGISVQRTTYEKLQAWSAA